jgi:hypothetical protein
VNALTAAYVPSSASTPLAFAAIVAAVFLIGYMAPRLARPRQMRALAWTLLIGGTLGVERLFTREPPGVRMIALIGYALLVMKIIVVLEEQARGMRPLSFGRWLGFAGAWLGMQPRLFALPPAGPLPGARDLIRRGLLHMVSGLVLIAAARLAWTATRSHLLASILLLPGLSLTMHFGVCKLLAGGWRLRSVPCEALFRAPLRSQNLGEFWAKRWNLAFSEMTAIAVYRPLAAEAGRGPALLAAFALSGLLHEMAISVPVRAGFGLPLLYFLLHGALVLVERARARAGHPLHGWIGRTWAFFWLAAPLPILFHERFLAGIVWPLIGIPAG